MCTFQINGWRTLFSGTLFPPIFLSYLSFPLWNMHLFIWRVCDGQSSIFWSFFLLKKDLESLYAGTKSVDLKGGMSENLMLEFGGLSFSKNLEERIDYSMIRSHKHHGQHVVMSNLATKIDDNFLPWCT